MTEIAYIALGGNVGPVAETFGRALALLDARADCRVGKVSPFAETAPVGGPAGQPNYINAVAEVETDLAPADLLAVLQGIEAELGRDRSVEQRWGPRTCDLDLLLHGQCVLDTLELTIPHPRMHVRRFVLEPLTQIAPWARHPILDKTAAELLAELDTP